MKFFKKLKKTNNKKLFITNFNKFLKIKWTHYSALGLKNLQISALLLLFLLEKKTLKKFRKFSLKKIWTRNISILHNKILFLENFKMFSFFNRDFFPENSDRKFLKKLFFFRAKNSFKEKLKKLNFLFIKDFLHKKQKFLEKKNFYYLVRDPYLSLINLKGYNIFFFKKKILASYYHRFFFYWNKFISIKKKFFNKKLSKLSIILSEKFKKLFKNNFLLFKIKKFKKKIFTMQFKADSFFKVFNDEFYVPYQNLFFWKSVIWFSNIKLFLLPTEELKLYNFTPLVNFFEDKFKKYLFFKADIFSSFSNKIEGLTDGFNFFNSKWFDKIFITALYFFMQFKWSFTLPIITEYVDLFFLQKKFLPISLRKLVKIFIMQAFNFKEKHFIDSGDTKNNKLMTLLFYNILSEVFQLVFGFSPAKIFFFDSKPWLKLFNNQVDKINFWTKNWEFLPFYSKNFLNKNTYKNNFFVYFINKKKNKTLLYDFLFFFRIKKNSNYKIDYKNRKKIIMFNLSNYIAKTYFPIIYLRPLVNWRFFYMWVSSKVNWLTRKLYLGRPKVIYDSYNNLQNKFWADFFFFKTSFERIINYGFCYWYGLADFSLDWNFLTTYKGNLGFKLQKKLIIKINKKKLVREKITNGFFSEMKKNSLFFSFFSFLNRSFLMQYIIQYGHTKSTFNTSYKDYLIMIYNDRFILNVLNIQLNLKRNLKLMFKMFYLGGFICLVGAFNILLDGLVSLYGSYSSQPYTRFIWVNGLFSNFDKIFQSIQIKMSNAYSSRSVLTYKSVRWLIRLWFTLRGLIQNLGIDISFFPSLYWSSWVFLESSARFYPTISISNTECFLPTVFLDYTIVSNDYSLLSLSFYINLLLISFKKSKILRQVEFSVYPQKLLGLTFKYKIIPYKFNIKNFKLLWQLKVIHTFLKWSKYLYFEFTRDALSLIFWYLFIYRRESLNLNRKQNFWRFQHFKNKKFESITFL